VSLDIPSDLEELKSNWWHVVKNRAWDVLARCFALPCVISLAELQFGPMRPEGEDQIVSEALALTILSHSLSSMSCHSLRLSTEQFFPGLNTTQSNAVHSSQSIMHIESSNNIRCFQFQMFCWIMISHLTLLAHNSAAVPWFWLSHGNPVTNSEWTGTRRGRWRAISQP